MEGKDILSKGGFSDYGVERISKVLSGEIDATIVWKSRERSPMPRFLGLAVPSSCIMHVNVFLHLRRALLFWCGHHCWSPSDVGWPVQWRIGSFCQKCHWRNQSWTGKVAAVFLFQMLLSYHSCMTIPRNVLQKTWGLMFIQGDTAGILQLLVLQELIKGLSGIERKIFWQGLVNLQIVPICFSTELCLRDIEHICSTLFLVKHFIL